MSDYLNSAAKLYGVEVEDIMAHALVGDEFVIVIDNGPKGCPKYRIPLDQLIEPEPEPLPVPAVIDLGDLGYRELQVLARDAGIPANQSATDLRYELLALEEEE